MNLQASEGQVFQDIRGELFIILSTPTMCGEKDFEEYIVYRPLFSDSRYTYIETNDEFFAEVSPESAGNKTGQTLAHVRVTSIDKNSLSEVPTSTLLKELYSRSDNPLAGIDVGELKSHIVEDSFVVADVYQNELLEEESIVSFSGELPESNISIRKRYGKSQLSIARQWVERYGNSRTQVLRDILIKVEDED